MFSSLRKRLHSVRGGTSTRAHENTVDPPPCQKPDRDDYGRPGFLKLTEDEYRTSDNHETRPIVIPKNKSALPWTAGYAECVGTSVKKNEDQTAAGEINLDLLLTLKQQEHCSEDQQVTVASLRGVYFGVFDGHGGAGAALMVADQLINHLQEKLVDVKRELFELALMEKKMRDHQPADDPSSGDEPQAKSAKSRAEWQIYPGGIKLDQLIIGALESAFHAMDEHIALEKASFSITGGCCTLVALFICGKLYIANAGDCRAVAYIGDEVIPLSTDFTADRDVKRIYFLAHCRPELTGGHFAINRFPRVLKEADIGQRVLCRMPVSSGWMYKEVTREDIRFPLVHGKGKLSRLMSCVGVSRSLGDHDLKDSYTKTSIKPFLSCTPEVQILDLRHRSVSETDVLVVGSDGLWDVMTNDSMGQLVRSTMMQGATGELHMGNNQAENPGWKMVDGKEASHDDITAVVVPLHLVASSTNVTLSPGNAQLTQST